MRTILFTLFLLLFIGALLIISNENLHLKDKFDAKRFGDLYYSWLLNLARQTKSVTGYIINLNWFPSDNLTFSNKNYSGYSQKYR